MFRVIVSRPHAPWNMLRNYATQFQVQHDKKLKEFSLGEGKEKAVLQYKELTPVSFELEHTIVPESLQGKGFGKLLAEAALEYALDKNIKVKVTCGFVKKYLEKNPTSEFKSILIE